MILNSPSGDCEVLSTMIHHPSGGQSAPAPQDNHGTVGQAKVSPVGRPRSHRNWISPAVATNSRVLNYTGTSRSPINIASGCCHRERTAAVPLSGRPRNRLLAQRLEVCTAHDSFTVPTGTILNIQGDHMAYGERCVQGASKRRLRRSAW